MFEVYEKGLKYNEDMEIRKKIRVYATQYKNGYPYFTMYEDGQWITRSAKYYIAVIDDEKEMI